MQVIELTVRIAAALALATAAAAQSATQSAAQRATVPFVDKSFGYELQVPAGWTYDRTGFFGPGGSLGTLRGAAPGGRETLQILVFRDQQQGSFPKWVDYFSDQLSKLSGAVSVRVEGGEFDSRPSAYVAVQAQIGFDRTRTLYFCVQFDADLIWVFSYAWASTMDLNAPEPKDDATGVTIPPGFAQFTSTLHIFYNHEAALNLAEALKRGREFLARYGLQEGVRKLRTDDQPRYYEILSSGKPIGFVTRQFSSESEPSRANGDAAPSKGGVRVRERAYRFGDEGGVEYGKVDIFSSRDGDTDLYEIVRAVMPPTAAADRRIWLARDQCVREGDALFSTYVTNQDKGLPAPRQPIKLDDSYLGMGWVRLLPALLGPDAHQTIAFTVYDPETRTLVAHAIEPLGKLPLPGKPEAEALAFKLREGFVETCGVFYGDEFGNMLRYDDGDLTLLLSDEKTINEKYGARREEADRRFQEGSSRP